MQWQGHSAHDERIRSNSQYKQSRVFDSVQNPDGASTEETIRLIRHLHVLPTDLQLAHSGEQAPRYRTMPSLAPSLAVTTKLGSLEGADQRCERLRLPIHHRPGSAVFSPGRFGLAITNFERDWETLSEYHHRPQGADRTELPQAMPCPITSGRASPGCRSR